MIYYLPVVETMQLDFLKQFGLSSYDIKALQVLIRMEFGTAAEISKLGNIPSSKVYTALENLVDLGMVLHSDNAGADIYQLVSNSELAFIVGELEQETRQGFADELRNFKFSLENLRAEKRLPDVTTSKVALLGTPAWQGLL
ncbi:hypothetical protein KC640_02275, partial [Candidatus Dojkabacteria bacterium]|nr:hypothetical protein [Candidatus Dojkabacteria bacterium]